MEICGLDLAIEHLNLSSIYKGSPNPLRISKVINNSKGGLFIKKDCTVQYLASTHLPSLVERLKLY